MPCLNRDKIFPVCYRWQFTYFSTYFWWYIRERQPTLGKRSNFPPKITCFWSNFTGCRGHAIRSMANVAPSMKFYHPPRESPRAMGCHVCIHFASLLLDSYLTHVNLARGGIQKSIARVHAHFSSPHSSRRLRRFSFAFVTFDRDTLFKQVSLLPGYARSTCWYEQQSGSALATNFGLAARSSNSQLVIYKICSHFATS